MQPLLERCDQKANGGKKYREAPEPENIPSPSTFCADPDARRQPDRSWDWICRGLADSSTEHDRLWRAEDAVRVMELYGYERAESLVQRMRRNFETARDG